MMKPLRTTLAVTMALGLLAIATPSYAATKGDMMGMSSKNMMSMMTDMNKMMKLCNKMMAMHMNMKGKDQMKMSENMSGMMGSKMPKTKMN